MTLILALKVISDYYMLITVRYVARGHCKRIINTLNHNDLESGCQGHKRSNSMVGMKSIYMVSYKLVMVTTCLGDTIYEIKVLFNFHDLDPSSQGHLRLILLVDIVQTCLGGTVNELYTL